MSKIIMGNKIMDIPIIQGGMGIGVSLSKLSGTVASLGGMGVISGVDPGYLSKDFSKNPIEANIKAIKEEIVRAKQIAKGKGIIAINIMKAINNYDLMVKASVDGGIDAIVSGAGMPLNLPDLVDEKTLIAPIVSSQRALKIILKTWLKKYNRLCDFVVVEGPLAGGHLGFKSEDIDKSKLELILKEVVDYVKEIELKFKKKIYIFAAGGIRKSSDVKKLIDIGADGVQVGTPFITTKECDVSENFKMEIINSKDEDLKIINSPVGMPARAISNKFIKELEVENKKIETCRNCLKSCDPKKVAYCISASLADSAKGESGLIFSGYGINNIREITSVKSVIDKLMEEI
ncbi:MAG: NAD(P)H-dependent flavin oxidoreductase [Peptoniphilaceae bacterium]